MSTSSKFYCCCAVESPVASCSPDSFRRKSKSIWAGSTRYKKGHFLAGEPLEEEGKLLSGHNPETITDGPFAESKEAIGGYFIISAQIFPQRWKSQKVAHFRKRRNGRGAADSTNTRRMNSSLAMRLDVETNVSSTVDLASRGNF